MVALAAVVIILSASATLGQLDRSGTLRWPIAFPLGDRPVAALAQLTERTTPVQLAKVGEAAQATLAAEPVSLKGLRTLGLVRSLQRQPQAAERIFRYAETLSRRDMATELWLIEHDVALGNVSGALTHYDHAMRTSATNRTLLIPILAGAANDPAVAGPLARVLSQRPNWWSDYMNQAVAAASAPASLFRTAQALALRPDRDDERVFLAGAIARLLTLGAPNAAAKLYANARHTGPVNLARVRDGGFAADPVLPPIDWSLVDVGEAAATRAPRGDGYALDLYGADGQMLAFQVLALRPGRYHVVLTVGHVTGSASGRPRVELRCLGGAVVGGDVLVEAPDEGRSMALAVDVPAGCALQTLAFHAGTDGSAADGKASWVDDVRVDPDVAGAR